MSRPRCTFRNRDRNARIDVDHVAGRQRTTDGRRPLVEVNVLCGHVTGDGPVATKAKLPSVPASKSVVVLLAMPLYPRSINPAKDVMVPVLVTGRYRPVASVPASAVTVPRW